MYARAVIRMEHLCLQADLHQSTELSIVPRYLLYIKNGHYGKIVGRGFDTLKEYHQRVLEAASEGADFIKIMTTGLLEFLNDDGKK